MLYFLIDSLNNLDRVYHYSMASFVQILKKGELSSLYSIPTMLDLIFFILINFRNFVTQSQASVLRFYFSQQ